MQMIYSNYKMNRTSTFQAIGNIRFHVKVAFGRDVSQNSKTGVILFVTCGFVHGDDIFKESSE
jgi:hypothetical protein